MAWLGAAVLAAMLVLLSGCRSKECARMLVCCQEIEGKEGVGQACGPRAASVDDPNTCLTILETVGYMYDDRDAELPEACRIEGAEE